MTHGSNLENVAADGMVLVTGSVGRQLAGDSGDRPGR